MQSFCKGNSKTEMDTDINFVYLQGTDYVNYEKGSLISKNCEKYRLADKKGCVENWREITLFTHYQ